jgi:hypothetical protein
LSSGSSQIAQMNLSAIGELYRNKVRRGELR